MSDINRALAPFQMFEGAGTQTTSVAIASGASTQSALAYPTTGPNGDKVTPQQFLVSNTSTTPCGVYFSNNAGAATATNVQGVVPAGGVKAFTVPGGPTSVATWGFGAGTGTATVTPGFGS